MSLYKQAGSQFWWCQFRVAGQLIRSSTGKVDREEAERWEREYRVQLEKATPTRRRGVKHLQWLSDEDVRRARKEGATDDHCTILRQRWDRTIAELGDVDPITITLDVLEGYIEARKVPKVVSNYKTTKVKARNQTIRRELADIRRALLRAKREGWITEIPEPWPSLKSEPKKAAQAGKVHSPAIVKKVLADLPPDVVDAARVCSATGLRAAELKRLRFSWVREVSGMKVPAILELPDDSTKSRRARPLGVNAEILKILKRRFKAHGDLLFPRDGYKKALDRACKRAGYEKTITLRDLRHMFATEKLKKSGDLAAVSKALGHASVATTALYLHADKVDAINLGGL